MKKLEVCFVGVGSIAKRHIRNLKEVCKTRSIQVFIDVIRWSGTKNEDLGTFGIRTVFYEISQLKIQYDIIFITNPTSLHIDTLKKYHLIGKNFFIEKPISMVSQIESAKDITYKAGTVYYVACPLRYSAIIQYIKKNININEVISIRSISSSYLPDWRIGKDYRETYSAYRDLGGGVDIDLIHEWDYLVYLFGIPDYVKCIYGKKSTLEIDSRDFAIYIAEYKDKIAEVHLDYFGRSTIREIMLLTKNDTIVCDLIKKQVTFLKENKKILFNEERDDYQKYELNCFLDMIDRKVSNSNDIIQALKILKLTQGEV